MEFTFSEWDMWKAWVMYRVNTNISYTHVSIKTIILGSLLEADSTGLGNTLVTEGYLQVRKGNATNKYMLILDNRETYFIRPISC